MAIHAITGVMGSGKSYEAVSEKIVPAFRDTKRRVITNIEGLDVKAIAEYCKLELDDVTERLVLVTDDRIIQPGFWYEPDEPGSISEAATDVVSPDFLAGRTNTVVQPGDLIVIDEVWRYYNRGTQLPGDAMRFFRMHRHYVADSTGLTCDLVLINQSLRGIHQDIRDIVEVRFQCRKLSVLGRPKNYQVAVIEGDERKASHTYIRTYQAKVFPLYKSYTGKTNGTETKDKRQNALSKPFFRFVLPLAVIAVPAGLWFLYHTFDSMGKPADTSTTLASTPAPGAGGASVAVATVTPAGSWRLVASYQVGGATVAMMVNEAGFYRTAPVTGTSVTVKDDVGVTVTPTDTKYITPFSGPAPDYNKSRSNR